MAWGNQPINHRACPDAIKEHCGASYDAIEVYNVEIPDERLQAIDSAQIQDLADSIREFGQIAPIGVWMITDPKARYRYHVIYGVKRAAAMRKLYDEAVEGLDDPRENPDAFRYSRLHALVYPQSISGDCAKEMEIRENLDRFELTEEQKQAQTALLLALLRRRQKGTKSKGKSKTKGDQVAQTTQSTQAEFIGNDFQKIENGKGAENGETGNGRGRPLCRFNIKDAARILGVSSRTVTNRINSINKALNLTGNMKLDPEKSSPEEFEEAHRHMMEIKPVKLEQKKEVKMAKSPRLNVNLEGDPDRVADSIRRCLRKYLKGDVVKHIVQVLYDEEIGL